MGMMYWDVIEDHGNATSDTNQYKASVMHKGETLHAQTSIQATLGQDWKCLPYPYIRYKCEFYLISSNFCH